MSKQKVQLLLVVGLLVVPLFGCVSKSNYEAVVTERDQAMTKITQIEAERDGLLDTKNQLNKVVAQTEQKKQAADKEAAAAKALVTRQEAVYNNLKSAFAKEQQQAQVKVEMMKSGIKVNLAEDILFPSGSAMLNGSGINVLVKAAAELKQVNYQTLVAGFTDNVAISGKLKNRYPSNWELAGARAASVVRLLEEQGVPAEQMVALSFGVNKPLMSNDTPENRSKNRRIEILLRPVPVQMR